MTDCLTVDKEGAVERGVSGHELNVGPKYIINRSVVK